MKLRNIFPAFAVLCIIFVGSLLLINRWVSAETSNQIYRDISQIPSRSVGLVLGTSKYIAKTLNPYYEYRIQAALELYKQDKINVFLLSGDNRHRSYNEPWTMKRDLLKAGVPDNEIVLDYAGFRTLDSIVRAKKVFEANHFVIITQKFHCERALFIAQNKNIDAICLAVPEPKGMAGLKLRIREVLARVKAVIDIYVLHEQPKFLGPKEPIEDPVYPPQDSNVT
ncbi:SanA/YdcF family protein [Photobacterium damselae]|uniref:SanA/YdcF family protein n=1 Tax=Photobacterium damselae TaxID=38293 RepID=UPI00083A3368|nr:ElyC/SanA/YdcF family protein [Photobacterium damselae]AWK81847.1 SanA protein [Photobacterium damselae]MCG3814840.1 YdcF family protein [Photobacterium damselae]MDC4168095.1 YdcF family protein [Photobacterium damselae]ODA26474.1 SanA protein [Photobacterium damselae subsp. damselae]TLS69611.1 SanA protein [Photobacterium damselae subsp. damselae]